MIRLTTRRRIEDTHLPVDNPGKTEDTHLPVDNPDPWN
jgi:hypothetical protein